MIADGFYNMDCFQGFNLIDDKSINLIICDLPFGTTQNDWDVILPLYKKGYKSWREHTSQITLFSMMKER